MEAIKSSEEKPTRIGAFAAKTELSKLLHQTLNSRPLTVKKIEFNFLNTSLNHPRP